MSDDGELQRVARERDLAVERFTLMCKAMNQCMWDWDIATNVAWYSDAIYSTFGIPRDGTHSFERWTTYMHPDDRERVVAGFRDVLARGKPEWADEYRFVRPNDGRVLDVFDRGFVVFADGKPARTVGVVMDISQQRALERHLQQSHKWQAVGRLAGGVAHDFGNMLLAAKLELELLRTKAAASPAMLAHVNALHTTIDRASSLTRQLLTFSRLGALRMEDIDLDAKLGQLTPMLRRLLGANQQLALQPTGETIHVDADSSMLDQILVNLVVNGRDAMPDGGTLSIATSRCGTVERPGHPRGPYVCIEVRDAGAGIPGDVLPRIFDPFFTTKTDGNGLGLATVHGIVEQHRGWIDVDSEPGVGTAFRVYLPERIAPPPPSS